MSYKNGPEHRNAAEPSHFLSERGAVSRMRQLGGDYAVFAPRILMTSPIRGPSRHRHPHSHCPYPTYHSYSPLATLGLPNTNYRMLLLIIVTRFFCFLGTNCSLWRCDPVKEARLQKNMPEFVIFQLSARNLKRRPNKPALELFQNTLNSTLSLLSWLRNGNDKFWSRKKKLWGAFTQDICVASVDRWVASILLTNLQVNLIKFVSKGMGSKKFYVFEDVAWKWSLGAREGGATVCVLVISSPLRKCFLASTLHGADGADFRSVVFWFVQISA